MDALFWSGHSIQRWNSDAIKLLMVSFDSHDQGKFVSRDAIGYSGLQ